MKSQQALFPAVFTEPLECRRLLSVGLVRDIYSTGAGGSSPSGLVTMNGVLYFSANDGHHGRELWRSDGTASGTAIVRDIIPGKVGSNPTALTNINGMLYFSVDDPTNGVEVWKSDGTTDGTVMVDQVSPLHGGVNQFTLINGTLYFQGNGQATSDFDLYANKGGVGGTTILRVASDNDNSTGEDFEFLTSFKGQLYFFDVEDALGSHDAAFYKTDGTISGTKVIKGFNQAFESIIYKDKLYFDADAADGHGAVLWRSDGTTAGTTIFSDLQLPQGFHILNDELVFSASDPVNGTEPRHTDGTVQGTGLLKDIYPGTFDSLSDHGVVNDGIFYFAASDKDHGAELWTSDGTEAGTQLFKDINTHQKDPNSYPDQFTGAGDNVYFVADDYFHGRELWVTDGTTAETGRISDFNPGRASSVFENLTNLNGTLFFTVDDGVHGTELWSVPGPFAALDGHVLRVTATDSADVLSLRVRGAALQVRLNGKLLSFTVADVDQIAINAGAGNDVVDWSGIAIPTSINAGTGNDSITAGGGDDSMTGAAGNDTLRGGGGNDRINGNNGDDVISGEAGNDFLHGGTDNDTLDGGGGVDRIFGEDGRDNLAGGTGNDKLYGCANPDRLFGQAGDDLLNGGGGNDTATADSGDTLADVESILK